MKRLKRIAIRLQSFYRPMSGEQKGKGTGESNTEISLLNNVLIKKFFVLRFCIFRVKEPRKMFNPAILGESF